MERQKKTGFLGIRMVELNRHLEKVSGKDNKSRESDSDGEKWENVRVQLGNEVATETTRLGRGRDIYQLKSN